SVLLPLHMSRMSGNFLFYPRLLSMQGESREATCPAQRNLRHQRCGKRINPGRERNKPPPCRATGQLIVLRRDLLVPVGLSPSSIFSKVSRSQYSSNRPFDAKSFTSASRRGVRPPYVHVSPAPLPQPFACPLLYRLLSLLNVREKSGELLHKHPKVAPICSRK